MVLALVTHLMRQAVYLENDIAVLTPYLGQMLKIRRRMAASFEVTMTEGDMKEIERQGLQTDTLHIGRPAKASLLKSIKVSTVDNFQGEEAKVVIISLVRSNTENKCGFLKTSNRINVLLSRAQHGMYITGNAATSGHVQMWADVLGLLKADNNFGSQLHLKCPRHPDTPILVSKPDDFVVLSPEGGCNLKCDRRLPCGHACINKCHSTALHNAVLCLEDCPRSLKGCDHGCPNRCGDPCTSKCQVIVECDVTLDCGHHRSRLPCWQSQNPSLVVCQNTVKRTVPGCEHEVVVPCYIDVSIRRCSAPCGTIMNCGHTCLRDCLQCKTRTDGVITSEDHGSCRQVCGRPYTACSHSCSSECHGGKPYPSCDAPCEVTCGHSRCYKKCSEPCTPCAEENCASTCPHQQCTMPCASPCNWLPCSRRCDKKLACGHQCKSTISFPSCANCIGPTICGEVCPSPQLYQTCADDNVQSTIVDYIMMSEYSELDLDAEPCIIPPCGHPLAVSTMDGHMEMSEHYEMDGNMCLKIKDCPKPFSMDEVKTCPTCRASLRKICRYGRIVRRALIDQSSKRFIMWAREETLRLMQHLHDQQLRLESSNGPARLQYKKQDKLDLKGSGESQLRDMNHALNNRYRGMRRLRSELARHSQRVAIEEQPFKRIWDLVKHVRRRQESDIDIPWNPDVVQVGESLRVQSLLFRCDLAIMADFLSMAEANVEVTDAKTQCLELVAAAKDAHLPLQQTEGHLFYARYCVMGRTSASADRIDGIVADGKTHVEEARRLCHENAGSTQLVTGELEEVENMLRESTFYSPMKDDEWKEIMAAMKREHIGTGHWYTCENGHPFTVGECGGPMQETMCPECGSPVGGRSHVAARGVRRAEDLERRIGEMNL